MKNINWVCVIMMIFCNYTLKSQIIFSEDFQTSGALPGAIPSTWTTNLSTQNDGSQGPSFRIYNASTANSGGYWPVPNLGAANNRFAGANDDPEPCDCDFMNVWIETPEISLPEMPQTLSFSFFHDRNFGGGDATVQISTDSGNSWLIIDTLAVDASFWQTVILDLTNFVNTTAKIRFQWSDEGNWASGFALDNILVQGALGHDMVMVKTIAADWSNTSSGVDFLDYSMIPITQANLIKASAVVLNGALGIEENVNINFEVTQNGIIQTSFSSPQSNINSLAHDTLAAYSTWIPDMVGLIDISATIVLTNSDEQPSNNSGNVQVAITENIYARDAGSAQAFFSTNNFYEAGNLFQIYNNQEFGAIDVAVNFMSANEGSLIAGKIYEFAGFGDNGDPMLNDLGIQTVEYAVTSADNSIAGESNFVSLSFTQPVMLEGGKVYWVGVISDGSVRLALSGINVFRGSWINDGNWGAMNSIPMIRLNGDLNLIQSIPGCMDANACNFNPSAGVEDGSCLEDNNNDGVCDEYENYYLPGYLSSNGLVGWWPFNGNANDESGNINHGQSLGAQLTADRTGQNESAYQFDGVDDFIECINPGPLGNPDLTLSFWIKSNQNTYGHIIGYGGDATPGSSCQVYLGDGECSGSMVFDTYQNSIAKSDSQENSWTFYNIVRESDSLNGVLNTKIFRNGILLSENCSEQNTSITSISGTYPIYFGRYHGLAANGFFQGALDDISIYDRALTDEEISALFINSYSSNGGISNNVPGPPAPSVPQGIPYQAMIRDNNGAALVNTPVIVRFSLRQDAIDGTVEYQETHNLTTNAFGLVNTHFGTGTATQGTFANINWSNTTKFIQVEANTGSGFVEMGTQQMMSVPFALKANESNKVKNAGLPVFADNAAALAGGLVAGDMYRTATGDLKIVY